MGAQSALELKQCFTSDGVTARSDLFSSRGAYAKQKFVILGLPGVSSDTLMSQTRSLNIEHVSPAELIQQEISRQLPAGESSSQSTGQRSPLSDETTLALLRRWFWARKPDAGFALTGFPATLLQAMVLDEWLEARDEGLDGVFVSVSVPSENPVVKHYRELGLLQEDAFALS